MFIELGLLAQAADDLITWQDRITFLFQEHRLQLACSMLIGAVLGLLGCFVVLRRMALIGDAISHAVLPGVVLAFLLVSTSVTGLFLGALVAAVVTAVAVSLVSRFSRAKEDAAIGVVFTAMFAVGVILISHLPKGVHFDLKCFLFGDALAIQPSDLLAIAVVTPIVVAVVVLLFHPLKLLSFDARLARTMGFNTTLLHHLLMVLLSATIVAALRTVGVIMAVAMLVTPAALAYQLTNRFWKMLVLAAASGALAAGVGMFLAFQFNTPPGPMMVLVATGLFLGSVALAPERGLVTAWLRRRRVRRHILEEDLLKALVRAEEGGAPAAAELAAAGPPTAGRLARVWRGLVEGGLASGDPAKPALTAAGRQRALGLLRSHRLWEAYLAEQQVDGQYVHPEAERLEHAHDLAEDLAEELGDPRADPHGHPIPRPSAARPDDDGR